MAQMGQQSEADEPNNLQTLLDRLEQAKQGKPRIALQTILDLVGFRSFGTLLLVPALIVLSPLSGVPGLPSIMAILVVLIAGQLLIGRHHFWLPGWLLHREVPCTKYDSALRFLRPIARRMDRLIKPRLTVLTRGAAVPLVALLCIAVAATMFPLELVPFGNSTAGATLTVFGLALIARDGLLVVIGCGFLVGLAVAVMSVVS